jgi:hypothetical protein
MGDPQPRQGFQEAGGGELRAIVGGEGQARTARLPAGSRSKTARSTAD